MLPLPVLPGVSLLRTAGLFTFPHLLHGWAGPTTPHLGGCHPSPGHLSPLIWTVVALHLDGRHPSHGRLSLSSPRPLLFCGPQSHMCVCPTGKVPDPPSGQPLCLVLPSGGSECTIPVPRMFFPVSFVSIQQSLLGHSTACDLSRSYHYLGTVPPLAMVSQWLHHDCGGPTVHGLSPGPALGSIC